MIFVKVKNCKDFYTLLKQKYCSSIQLNLNGNSEKLKDFENVDFFSTQFFKLRVKHAANIFERVDMVPVRLREARKKASLTQEKLGVLVGIDESTARSRISYYESGTNSPSFDTAIRIAQVLDIPVSYLYTPEDDLAEEILRIYADKKAGKA